MSCNEFDLNNIISLENRKDSYQYKKSEESLENFFDQRFAFKVGYNNENDEEMYCHVLLSYRDYNCLNDLCRLVNINIEGYSRMKYYLPNNDIRYITCSYCLYYLPDCCFDYLALKNTNLYLRN